MIKYPTFEDFYFAIHGFYPYEWQKGVAQYVDKNGHFPEQISVPTGLGKTSNIDIAIWGIGKQIHEGKKRTLGQRVVLAVERQVIVDGISQHVKELVNKVNHSPNEIIQVVRDALLSLSFDDVAIKEESFHGTKRSSGEWVDASGVTIISTTVTQTTLRLLGQSPGASRNVAPIHAGLLAKDSLIFIDEPHLVTAQVSALKQILSIEEGLSRICIMGATVQKGLIDEDKIYMFNKDQENEFALNKIKSPKILNVEQTHKSNITESSVQIVTDYVKEHDNLRIGVIVNTIQEAQKIARKLQPVAKKNDYSIRVITSHIRGADRPSPEKIGIEKQIVIATQTVEAGADFTVDVLISELCPIPSLWQRLGRLNRDGSSPLSRGYVLIPKDNNLFGTRSSRFIYEEIPLDVAARGLLSLGSDIDVCVENQRYIEDQILKNTQSQREDMWTSSPTPVNINKNVISKMLGLTTSPRFDVSAFLSGIVKDPHDNKYVNVLWRDPLPIEGDVLDKIIGSLKILRPMTAEMISLDITNARKLLESRDYQYVVMGNDGTYHKGGRINPGNTIVINSYSGGLTDKGVEPSSNEKVSDVSLPIALEEDLGEKNRFAPLTQSMIDDIKNNSINVNYYYALIMENETSIIDIRNQVSRDVSDLLGYRVETKIQDNIISIRKRPKYKKVDSNVLYLDSHLSQVGNLSYEYGKRIGLNDDINDSLRSAGWFHDLGKCNNDFQTMLGKLDDDRHLAKSTGRITVSNIEGLSGYLHEIAGSEYVLENYEDSLASWIIAAHHGRVRGITKNRPDLARYTNIRLELEKEYGVYGLIYLESIMRCSDWRSSAKPDYEIAPEEDVLLAILNYDKKYESFDKLSVQKENHLYGLSGSHLPSWYAIVGILHASQEIGIDTFVKWENAVPIVNIDDDELHMIINHMYDKFFADHNVVNNEINSFSTNDLTIKNQRINIDPENIKTLFNNLDNNIFQYLFSPWIQSGSISDKNIPQWSFVSPFLAANSNVFRLDSFKNIKADDIINTLKNNFVGWDSGFSVDNLNLGGEQFHVNCAISLLALYGGLSDLPLGQFGLGSTVNNDRVLPMPSNWVNLNDLTTLTYGMGYFKEVKDLTHLFGENDKKKSQKIREGRLIIK